MGWRVVERRIGRAGGVRQRTDRQRAWDREYGEGNWEVGYVIGGAFVPQEQAVESVYHRSYAEHFAAHASTSTTVRAVGNELSITVAGGRDGSQTVRLSKGTTFAYKLHKVKDWNKGKTRIEDMEADYKGFS